MTATDRAKEICIECGELIEPGQAQAVFYLVPLCPDCATEANVYIRAEYQRRSTAAFQRELEQATLGHQMKMLELAFVEFRQQVWVAICADVRTAWVRAVDWIKDITYRAARWS